MRPMRLVLVTRRFWPLVGGAERVMAELATEFQAAGAEVTLVTAQWQRDWPREISHRGVRVVRLPQPATRWYGTWRYMRGLGHWLTANRGDFDLVYVSMLKHDAYAALGVAARLGFPVVLRAEGAGVTGDMYWQLESRLGWRIRSRCKTADAFIAPSPLIEREFIASGYRRDRVHYIPNAVAVPARGDERARLEARGSLAEAHPLLAMAETAPVALYTGRLHEAKGIQYLVAAWSLVSARLPDARLWIVGDGPYREELFRQIADLGLDGRVVLCGAFDAVDEFLAAADLFVLPSLEEGMSLSLLEALAAERPVIATDIAANQALVEHERQGLLVPPQDPQALAAAVLRLFSDRALAQTLGQAGRQRVEREFSLSERAGDHLRLFERLVAQRGES